MQIINKEINERQHHRDLNAERGADMNEVKHLMLNFSYTNLKMKLDYLEQKHEEGASYDPVDDLVIAEFIERISEHEQCFLTPTLMAIVDLQNSEAIVFHKTIFRIYLLTNFVPLLMYIVLSVENSR